MPQFPLLKDIGPPSHGEMGKTSALGRLKHVQTPETPVRGWGRATPQNLQHPSVLPLHPRGWGCTKGCPQPPQTGNLSHALILEL